MTNHPDFYTRRAFFDGYQDKMIAGRRELSPRSVVGYTCPCCGYPMLSERAMYEICLLCWWEDDGLDDDEQGYPGDLDRVSGPNHMTLREARKNFEEYLFFRAPEGRVIRGMNDEKANEGKRRTVEAFDDLLGVSGTEEIMALLMVVNEALAANWEAVEANPLPAKRKPSSKYPSRASSLRAAARATKGVVGAKEKDTAEIRERLLKRYASGSHLWLHRTYWEFGGDVRAQYPDHARAPTIELLSEMLRSGDIVAGTPKGWFGFEPWDLSPEESIERISQRWDALEKPPNHGDVAAFAMPEARRARWKREHPKSAEEIERIRGSADSCIRGLTLELEDLPEVVEDWEQMSEYGRISFQDMWHMEMIDNDLIALECYHREGHLTTAQEERYGKLKDALRASRSTLEELGVDLPSEVLDA